MLFLLSLYNLPLQLFIDWIVYLPPFYQFSIAKTISTTLVTQTMQFFHLSVLEGKSPKWGLAKLKSKCRQPVFLSGGSRGESIPLSFPVSRHHLHCLAHGLLQSQQCWVESFSGFIISLFFPLLSLSFDYKDPYIEVTQINQNNLFKVN